MVIGLARTALYLLLCLCAVRAFQEKRNSFHRSEPLSKYQRAANPSSLIETKLRHSRYQKFDKVMTRIENFSENMPEDTSQSSIHNKFRHKGWGSYYRTTTTSTTTTSTTPPPLFDTLTYGDIEDEYSEDDDLDYDEDDNEDFEDEKDEEYLLFDTIADDIQAEEPTERSTTIPPRPVSSLTEFKWNNYGTMQKVEKSRNQQLKLRQPPEQVKVSAFLEHYVRVNQQTKCQTPLPKVIPVQKEHPNASKIYTPSCTVLHRCDEDTGCCNKHTKCQYKSRVLVQLYFYAHTLERSQNRVEKLDFYNHTECECRSTKNMSEEIPQDPAPQFPFKSARHFSINTPQTVKRCTCPTLFQDARYSHKCACDCAFGNEDCLQFKEGKEHFNLLDRICIQEGKCGVPICEHGVYLMKVGKCPTKKEKLEEYSKIQLNYG